MAGASKTARNSKLSAYYNLEQPLPASSPSGSSSTPLGEKQASDLTATLPLDELLTHLSTLRIEQGRLEKLQNDTIQCHYTNLRHAHDLITQTGTICTLLDDTTLQSLPSHLSRICDITTRLGRSRAAMEGLQTAQNGHNVLLAAHVLGDSLPDIARRARSLCMDPESVRDGLFVGCRRYVMLMRALRMQQKNEKGRMGLESLKEAGRETRNVLMDISEAGDDTAGVTFVDCARARLMLGGGRRRVREGFLRAAGREIREEGGRGEVGGGGVVMAERCVIGVIKVVLPAVERVVREFYEVFEETAETAAWVVDEKEGEEGEGNGDGNMDEELTVWICDVAHDVLIKAVNGYMNEDMNSFKTENATTRLMESVSTLREKAMVVKHEGLRVCFARACDEMEQMFHLVSLETV